MIRRRLIIEWNDEGTDTDEECAKAFLMGEFTMEDLADLDRAEKLNEAKMTYQTDLKVWVEDAPK